MPQLDSSNLWIILGGLGALFFGYFFGLFEGRGQGYKKRQKEEAQEKQPIPPPSPPAAPVEAPSAPRAETKLLALGQDADGHLQVELDGRRVDAAALTPEQRRRLVNLLVMMRPLVEGGTVTPPSASTLSKAEGLNAGAPSQPAPAAPPSARPQPTPIPPAAEPPAAATSIVAQINAILQGRIANTPLAERGIHLQESLRGGVLVFVGTNRYEGVDQVPDAEVQAAIRAAIAEWEQKQTPG